MNETLTKDRFYRLKRGFSPAIFQISPMSGCLQMCRTHTLFRMANKPLSFVRYTKQKVESRSARFILTNKNGTVNIPQFKHNNEYYFVQNNIAHYSDLSYTLDYEIYLQHKKYDNNNKKLSGIVVGELYTMADEGRIYSLYCDETYNNHNYLKLEYSIASFVENKKVILLKILDEVFFGTNHTHILKILYNNNVLYTLPNYIKEFNVDHNHIHLHQS